MLNHKGNSNLQRRFSSGSTHSSLHSIPFRLSTTVVLTLAVAVLSVAPGWAFDVKTAKLIDGGFKVFTTEKFNGNGRTCSTCHIPQNDYTISPADIAQLTVSAHQIVLGGENVELENPTLVDRFGIFNITNDTPGEAGPGFTPPARFAPRCSLAGWHSPD